MTLNNFQDGSPFTADGLNALANAHDNEGVLNGCAPSKGTGNFDVDIASGNIIIEDTNVSVSPQTVTLNSPDASDRVDIVTIDNAGTASGTTGTPATNPNAPDIPDDEVLIAAIFVDSGASDIAGVIDDYRVIISTDAQTYKGNDIDSDGDGKVDSAVNADSATDADNLNGVAPSEYNTFDVTTSNQSISGQGFDSVDFNIPMSDVISVFVRINDNNESVGFDGGTIEFGSVENNSGDLRVNVNDSSNDGTHNYTIVVLHS